jgi:hypothetical protein
VAEDGHQGLQAHPGVSQFGGIGMTELARGHVERQAAGSGQGGRCGGGAQALADPPGAKPSAMLGDQEVGGFPGARVGVWPLLAAVLGPGVKSCHGGGIERDGAFGAQLAERDAQPRAGGPVVGDAAELKVKALAQAQPGAAQQQDR